MLFAESWTVQDYLLLIGAVAVLVERGGAWLKAMWREEAKIKREQEIEDRLSLKTERKIESVKDTITTTTRALEVAAVKREEKLDAVVADQKVLVKQTDGMQTALNAAIEEGSFAKGRLAERDKAEIVHEVVEEVNGHGGKLAEVAATTKEIKADTSVLVNEIAADVKDVKDRLPGK